jgi:hypothetical protein
MYSDQVKERSEKLKIWLQGRPRGIGVAVAVRSSMRALPVFWNWAESSPQAKEWQVPAMPPLWANLAAWLVAMRRSESNRASAESASQHCDSVATDLGNKAEGLDDFGADVAASAGTFAALHAGEAYTPHPDKTPHLSVLYASCCGGTGHRKSNVQFLDAALRDCSLIDRGKPVIYEPLWLGEQNVVEKDWREISARLGPKKSFLGSLFGSNKPAGTNIWWDWYQRALDGRGQVQLEELEAMSWKLGQSFPRMWVIPSPEERAQQKL